MLELLLASSRGEEECRNVVAECSGRLALLHPSEVLARLRGGLGSDSEHTRAVVVGAVKYMAVDRPHPLDELLKVRDGRGPPSNRGAVTGDDKKRMLPAAVLRGCMSARHQSPGLCRRAARVHVAMPR